MTVRELYGWSPAQVTLDADGNVVSVTVTEPRFTVGERELLLASRRAEAVPVNEYGIPLVDAMDPDRQFKWDARYRTDWTAEAVRRKEKALKDANPKADFSAIRWSVVER